MIGTLIFCFANDGTIHLVAVGCGRKAGATTVWWWAKEEVKSESNKQSDLVGVTKVTYHSCGRTDSALIAVLGRRRTVLTTDCLSLQRAWSQRV